MKDRNPIAPATVEGARSIGILTFENQDGRMMEGAAGASIMDLRGRGRGWSRGWSGRGVPTPPSRLAGPVLEVIHHLPRPDARIRVSASTRGSTVRNHRMNSAQNLTA